MALPLVFAAAVALHADDAAAVPPAFIRSEIVCSDYDGMTDDLLTGGLGATDPATGDPVALGLAAERALFGNGIPPTGGVNVINNASPGGAKQDQVSLSPSPGRADQNLDGALCLRSLATGRDAETGERLRGQARCIARGIAAVRAGGP